MTNWLFIGSGSTIRTCIAITISRILRKLHNGSYDSSAKAGPTKRERKRSNALVQSSLRIPKIALETVGDLIRAYIHSLPTNSQSNETAVLKIITDIKNQAVVTH